MQNDIQLIAQELRLKWARNGKSANSAIGLNLVINYLLWCE